MIYKRPGDTVTTTLIAYKPGLVGSLTVALRRLATNVLAIAATPYGIVEQDPGGDRSNYTAHLALPGDLSFGVYQAEFADGATILPDDELVEVSGQLVGGDPLATPVPSGYAPGTAGAALGRLLGGPLGVVSPLSRQSEMTLIPGDDYLLANGNQIDVPHVDGDAWPPDLTGWTLKWRARDLNGNRVVEAATVTAPTLSGAGQFVRIELAASVTQQLATSAGRSVGAWVWAVEATKDPSRRTLRSGALTIVPAP